jgi:hypothetical protein
MSSHIKVGQESSTLEGGPHGVLWTHAQQINSEVVTFPA